MKRFILIIGCCLFLYIEANAQLNKELKDSIELPKLELKNKKLKRELISELINKSKDEWHSDFVYSIQIDNGERRKSYKFTITLSKICDIKGFKNIGFLEIQGYVFIIRGIYPNTLYMMKPEKRIFECIEYYRVNNDLFEPMLPTKWEPPIWIYSFEKNKLKCLEVKKFN